MEIVSRHWYYFAILTIIGLLRCKYFHYKANEHNNKVALCQRWFATTQEYYVISRPSIYLLKGNFKKLKVIY